jgi:hypothetical protein
MWILYEIKNKPVKIINSAKYLFRIIPASPEIIMIEPNIIKSLNQKNSNIAMIYSNNGIRFISACFFMRDILLLCPRSSKTL